MVTETITTTTLAGLVREFGFPIGVSIVLLCLFIGLVIYLVSSLNEKLKEDNKSLKEMNNQLTNVCIEMKGVSIKLDECINKIDDLESKSMAYVFREGKINKIKNNQEIDVTHDILQTFR